MLGLPPHRLLPGDAEPGEVLVDRRLVFRPAARRVDVLDAQQQPPAGGARHLDIEQRRQRMAEMQIAVRARREAENGRASSQAWSWTATVELAIIDEIVEQRHHDRHILHTEADLRNRRSAVLIKPIRGWRRCSPKAGMPALRRREGGFAGLCAIVCGAAAFDRERGRDPGPAVRGVRSVPPRRAAAARAPTSSRGSACRGRRSRRSRRSARRSPEGTIDLDARRRHGGRRRARGADRAARHRAVDRRHLSAVLPRPCRRLAGRRPRACRRRRASRSACGSGRTPRRWPSSPKHGGRGAGWRRICCGPIITSVKRREGAPVQVQRQDTTSETNGGTQWPLNSTARGSSRAPAPAQAARRVPARLWRRRQRPDRHRPRLAGRCCRTPPSSRRTRPSPAARRRPAGNGFRSPSAIRTSAGSASTRPRPALERFLDAELTRRKLPPSALALVGFSQGTMMALHVGLRRADARRPPIVGYSGMLVLPDDAKPGRDRRRDQVAAAGAADPWRPGRPDSARRRCSRPRKARARSTCRSNGTCRPASATASTRKACATAANSWPGGFGKAR